MDNMILKAVQGDRIFILKVKIDSGISDVTRDHQTTKHGANKGVKYAGLYLGR
jgi:hypothetical protein